MNSVDVAEQLVEGYRAMRTRGVSTSDALDTHQEGIRRALDRAVCVGAGARGAIDKRYRQARSVVDWLSERAFTKARFDDVMCEWSQDRALSFEEAALRAMEKRRARRERGEVA